MDITLFDYEYPEELIAQQPLPERSTSRLMVLGPRDGVWEHKNFAAFADFFARGDLLVFNDVRVMPSRLIGRTEKGRELEVLLLDQKGEAEWSCLVRPANKISDGAEVFFGEELQGRLSGSGDQWSIQLRHVGARAYSAEAASAAKAGFPRPGDRQVSALPKRAARSKELAELKQTAPLHRLISEIGLPPLPPYIRREDPFAAKADDVQRYQTVYAQKGMGAAAPTAGFHFTDETLCNLQNRGCELAYVTLHVSRDTFQPVRVNDITEHVMHGESYEIPEETAEKIGRAKRDGRRVTAIGTTTLRALESAGDDSGGTSAGYTKKFIYPGYEFQIVDRLLTNFHQPKSTLLMLVSAFAGREFILETYQEAIREHYRLFSFGDAMLILNKL